MEGDLNLSDTDRGVAVPLGKLLLDGDLRFSFPPVLHPPLPLRELPGLAVAFTAAWPPAEPKSLAVLPCATK